MAPKWLLWEDKLVGVFFSVYKDKMMTMTQCLQREVNIIFDYYVWLRKANIEFSDGNQEIILLCNSHSVISRSTGCPCTTFIT
jgi:hypothetical protein